MKKLKDNFVVFGNSDDATIQQMLTCLGNGGDYAVLCADNHKGYAQPIGGVLAYRNLVSISGVGFDIGCGNLAIQTDAKLHDVQGDLGKIMDQVVKNISFGVGRTNNEKVDHILFESPLWKAKPFSDWKKMAEDQLGTVGSGNHYVDIFSDENENIWVGVHFGSRGFGHKTATHFLNEAGGKDGMDVPPTVVSDASQLGQDYLAYMELAGLYAHAGREYVANHVVKNILGANVINQVHNHHNFAWREKHFGEYFWVVRKGATPAFPGQRGFIGGSMGDDAVIIEGVASELSDLALNSTVHGAGRIMSRTQAKGKFIKKDGKKIRQDGLVRHDKMMEWLTNKGVTLRGGDLDEAPQAYRRLNEVLDAHSGTIKILHTLRPIGVAMAGKEVKDPYQD